MSSRIIAHSHRNSTSYTTDVNVRVETDHGVVAAKVSLPGRVRYDPGDGIDVIYDPENRGLVRATTFRRGEGPEAIGIGVAFGMLGMAGLVFAGYWSLRRRRVVRGAGIRGEAGR